LTIRRLQARVGDDVEPAAQLLVQVGEVAEAAREEEVLADVTEWALDFTLGLRAIGPAGFRIKAVMTCEVDQRAIVDDALVMTLAEHCRLHAVVEDLPRRAAQRLERRDMAAQHGCQVLMHDEARPDQPAEAEHHGKQPHHSRRLRLAGEHDMELGEVDVALFPGRGLEANLKMRIGNRTHVAQEVGHRGVAAGFDGLLLGPMDIFQRFLERVGEGLFFDGHDH
jgi:hypothetical protein